MQLNARKFSLFVRNMRMLNNPTLYIPQGDFHSSKAGVNDGVTV